MTSLYSTYACFNLILYKTVENNEKHFYKRLLQRDALEIKSLLLKN